MQSDNVHCIETDGRTIILVGTAHVSKKSVEEVRSVIEAHLPDTVCVELCQARYQSITDADKWKNTDIIKIIKERKALLLLANLLMSTYQKKLGERFGIKPGQEMIQAIESAKQANAELCLADRDIQVTMMRLWRGISFLGKLKLFFQMLLGMAMNEELSEEEMEKMKNQDMLSAALEELSRSFPQLKTYVIDERDSYLAEKIRSAPGEKIVAVLGAGHLPGVMDKIHQTHDLKTLSKIPPASKIAKYAAWLIPLIIVGAIISTISVDRATGIDQIMSWILWNGSLGVLGAVIAFAHPLAILTAFVAAPISSLSPLLAAGWFAGLTEAMVRKPNVSDFENLSEDIQSLKGFWRNKVTHVLLVVVFANLGSTAGTIIGGADVLNKFFGTFFR